MKKINCLPLNLDVISFVLFPQASEPSLNINISKNGLFCYRLPFLSLVFLFHLLFKNIDTKKIDVSAAM